MTDYVEKIKSYTFGGNVADGSWVYKRQQIYNANPRVINDYISEFASYDLSSYLPDDNFDYEVLVNGFIYTGTHSGDTATLSVMGGRDETQITDRYVIIASQDTKRNSFHISSGCCILPIYNSTDSKYISIFCYGGHDGSSWASGTEWKVWVSGYRRIGTNDSSASNLVEKINIPNNNLTIGGNIFNGQWIYPQTHEIYVGDYTAGTTYEYNLKTEGFLPDDNYDYEVLLGCWANTGSSSGNWVHVYLKSNRITGDVDVTAQNTRYAHNTNMWHSAVFPLGTDGILKVKLNGSASADFGIYIYGYRRCGTNT